jgi:hypothetical protein
MKQSRLLEIIREEIAGALDEAATTYAGKTAIDDLKKDKAFGGLTGDAKSDAMEKLSSGGTVTIGEEDLNEIPDFGGRYDQQVAAKYGEDQTLEDATKDITDEILKDMGISRDDIKKDADKAKEVLKAIRSKVVGKARDPRVSKALEKQEEFDDSGNALQANQTNNAILKALGLKDPGKRGRKASEVKPVKSEKPSISTPSTTTMSEPEDDEDAAATKAAGSDEMAKKLDNTSDEKKIKFNQFLSSVKKNKEDKAKTDAILTLAKNKFKFAKSMMDDLKRAAGRDVEV